MMRGGLARSMQRGPLLAVTGLYRNPLASFGATARQHRLPGFGLHPRAEPVGLAPPPAVWLKRALRHPGIALLLRNFCVRQTLSISNGSGSGQFCGRHVAVPSAETDKPSAPASQARSERDSVDAGR